VPWTSIRRRAMTVETGPTVIPRQTACFRCYEQRRAGHGIDVAADGAPTSGWFHVAAGPELLALEVVKLLTGFGETATLGRVVVFDPLALTVAHHRVLRLPDCPRCAGRRDEPPEIVWRPLA
jgi:bacteriocin biosynthesis cyclodehydratase domain-containing protein